MNEEKNQLEGELLRLAGRVCDGTITPDEVERLDGMLMQHPELRDAYLAYLHLNADLLWRYRTGDAAASSDVLRDAKGQPADAAKKTREISHDPTVKGTQPGTVSTLGIILTIAAALLLALTGFWIGRVQREGPFDDRPLANRQPIETPAFVATLIDASAAVWTGEGKAIDVGARVRPGEIRLDSGDAELVFDSGATIVLSGPADMRLESSLSAYLGSGELVAHMPDSAIGFRVRTATAEYVDQGTEFGVVAQKDGPSEVHVFRGQVDVHAGATVNAVELFDGQAMRVEKPDAPGESIAYSKARFGGLALRVASPIQWRVAAGGNDHFYQLVVTKYPVSWHQAAYAASRLYYMGMPGHLVTVTSAEEDKFLADNVIDDSSARGIWIGLTDVLQESRFRWVTGEPVDYTNWAKFPSQQPDNYREADWHGGEDYGMYTALSGAQPWAWNDLSIDSMHEKISAYLIEYEPPVDALKHRSMTMEPIEWSRSVGGNGHHYRLVLSMEPASWDVVRRRASESSFNGSKGQLVVLETKQETEFVVDKILRVCGIPENMIGLSGSRDTGLKWVTGEDVGDIEVGRPYLPTDKVYGLLRWDHINSRWDVQTRSMEVQPESWFGYLVEYPRSVE